VNLENGSSIGLVKRQRSKGESRFHQLSARESRVCGKGAGLCGVSEATGLPVAFDQFHLEETAGGGPDGGWARWCIENAKKSACVLIVCSKGWFDAAQGDGPFEEGLGVAAEAGIFLTQIYRHKSQNARVRLLRFRHHRRKRRSASGPVHRHHFCVLRIPCQNLEPHHLGAAVSATWSADGRWLATVGEGEVTLWEWVIAFPVARLRIVDLHPAISRAEFSPDAKLLVTYGGDQVAYVWDLTKLSAP
jgi:hypothetical protein